ncbi:hypothetical protein E7Z59_04535 [Robertkochia marina]|uniref:Uncharacterized protein n=1 Tax=Robertkochia marina TaxID=1227945 RepID=A0A4S3M4J2_9FLAO|nr:hypothetical protein [Robertkochia marina]THD69599.1 hypothetical protein E7Z59_04535 [Robertkochia marina]TRZ47146.1 hypothetical protein D3A96_00035 [Robertkochia marina]
MKLRIKGDTIRMRLTQGEVDEFRNTGRVTDTTTFSTPSSSSLEYALVTEENGRELCASFSNNSITIHVPKAIARKWTETGQVGFDNREKEGVLPTPYILVEKDFKCLHKRPNEDESDHFPNPLS